MLFNEKDIKEIYDLKHRNDKLTDKPYDYENNLLKRTLSPHMFNNPNLREYIIRIEKMMVLLFDNISVVRNFKNYIVDKYYNKHVD